MLKRYWLVTYPTNWNGPKNFGVTAFSIDHAKFLVVDEIKRLGWTHLTENEIIQAESIENIDIRELDQNHVIPNIGVVSRQGVWYPNSNS